MKNLKIIGFVGTIILLLSTCFYKSNVVILLNQKEKSNIRVSKTLLKVDNTFLNHSKKSSRITKQLAGSTIEGKTVINEDNSIACTLENWRLIGIYNNNQLISTEGEFAFRIANRDSKSHRFVLAEVLILDREGNVVTTSNPLQKLQGQLIEFSPPIESTQTRIEKKLWKYGKDWYKVTLKTCQWLESESDYFEIYPELKDYSIP